MKSKFSILGAVLVSLFVVLSGCVDCEKDADCKEGQSCSADGVCGAIVMESAGIEGSFIQPLEEIWDGDIFPVDVQVENKGEYDLEKDKLNVYLGGISFGSYGVKAVKGASYFTKTGVIQDKNSHLLSKIIEEGSNIAPGGIEDLDFGTDLTAPTGIKGAKVTLTATMCYPYKTTAISTVCVGDVRPGETYTCKSNEDKTVISSTAPVQITKVYQSGSGNSHTFTINFANVGNGIAYVKALKETDVDNCIISLDRQDKDKIMIKSVKIGTKEIPDCKDKEVSLAAGRVVCAYASETGAVSEDQLSIELNYNYKDQVMKSYEVKGV